MPRDNGPIVLAARPIASLLAGLSPLEWQLASLHWSSRALQEGFVDPANVGLASMYPASDWSVAPRAIMDISARAFNELQGVKRGSQTPGRTVLHFVSSSRAPRQRKRS
jgi:hypothetical protein